jgi:hypothetical protein
VEIQLLNSVVEKERERIAALEAARATAAVLGNSAASSNSLELENASLKMRVADLKAACDASVRRCADFREQLCVERAKNGGNSLLADTSALSPLSAGSDS